MQDDLAPSDSAPADLASRFFDGYRRSGLAAAKTLGEREWIDNVLLLANRDERASFYSLLLGVDTGQTYLQLEDPQSGQVVDCTGAEYVAAAAPALLAALTDFLSARVVGRAEGLRSNSLKLLGDPSDRVLAVQKFVRVGSELRRVTHVVPSDLNASIAFAAYLLLAIDRPYGDELCRCQLRSCRRFFFELADPRGGQRGRKYCSPAHREQFHAATGSERTRRSREKAKKLKNARRPK